MSDKNEAYEYQLSLRPLQQIVNIPNPLYKSLQGVYFVGQTPSLFISSSSNAWAALVNPINSDKNLFVNVFTISSFSPSIITAEIWLNTNLPGNPATSSLVSPSNTALSPEPRPDVLLQYVQSTNGVPSGGVNVFDRIIPPNNTLVSEEDGKFIIPPGGNFALFLRSSSSQSTNAIMAFGWWEKNIKY